MMILFAVCFAMAGCNLRDELPVFSSLDRPFESHSIDYLWLTSPCEVPSAARGAQGASVGGAFIIVISSAVEKSLPLAVPFRESGRNAAERVSESLLQPLSLG